MFGKDRKIVLGLGNILNRDEGLGVHCLKPLQERIGNTHNVELLDGGVLGMNLLPFVEASSHLLLLDAIDARKEPGTVIELSKDAIPLYTQVKMSQHQVTFQEVLEFAAMRGKFPKYLHLIGAQPEDIEIGAEMSSAVAAAIPEIVERAMAILKKWELLEKDL
ncbi:MAG: HyaD/HybD family hydrogenase maturation endopeptidase [Calditrichia bacterium]